MAEVFALSGTIRPLLDLLSGRERRRLVLVLLAAIIAAGFEALSVASILPFMAIVITPDAMTTSPMLQTMATWVGAETWRDTVFWAALGTGILVAVGNASRLGAMWLQWQFEARVRQRLSSDLLRAFLLAPYAFHLSRPAPSLMRAVGDDVSRVTGSVLMPILTGIANAVRVGALLGLLALQNPLVAAAALATLGGAYYLVFRLARLHQARLADRARDAEFECFTTSHEAFAGIKELIALDRRETFSDRFSAASRRGASADVSKRLGQVWPRHFLETLTIGGILTVTVVLLGRDEAGAASTIPTLALYAFVGYRLMPGFQQLYAAGVSLRYGRSALQALHDDRVATAADPVVEAPATPALPFNDRVSLQHVFFTYPASSRAALSNVTLDIRRGESVGLIGPTGAGKSTLADILLGLFAPDAGTLTIDGVPLTPESTAAWRRQVGYVAQHIFLADASVAQNIAFGVPFEQIDHTAVREAAVLAQIDTFIEAQPNGYASTVGERGVRLSGGERQRIGIARALYRRPSILIFDEATSALDGLTEEAVMEAIRRLSGDRTVVLIAHRLRTLDACDRLVLLDAGRVVADGSASTLTASSDAYVRFRGKS